MASTPTAHAAAFRGRLPDGTEILIDLWADGGGDMSLRPRNARTWGAPIALQRIEVAS